MFDAVTLAAVADELRERTLHGRVQEIVHMDALTFGFEIYAQQQRRYLYVSARPDQARVNLASQKLRSNGEARAPFTLLLRKYVQNALVAAIEQLPNERVLKLGFDHSRQGTTTLVVETIGRYANVILLGPDGVILDAAKRVPARVNRAREILPRRSYIAPPSQAKLDLVTLTTERLAAVLLKNSDVTLAQTLVKSIVGVSPLLGRETEFRAGKHASAEEILTTLKGLAHAPWNPCVAYEDIEPAAFAPYTITHLPRRDTFTSISAAIEAFYGDEEPDHALKETLRGQISSARDKLARKRDALVQSLPTENTVERLRESGELILAYAAQIRAGQKILRAESPSGTVEIKLDEKLSAVENAQRHFGEYRRAKDAARRVPALLGSAQIDLDYAEQILNDLELAENRAEIDAVVLAAREAGLIATHGRRKVPPAPGEPPAFESEQGHKILVGKNARQNEEITFKRAKPDDLWMHARGVAGAHVVILGNGRRISDATIQQAARLAAKHSQAREQTRVDVIVTERRNVRRVRRGKPGMVTVKNERVVRVDLN